MSLPAAGPRDVIENQCEEGVVAIGSLAVLVKPYTIRPSTLKLPVMTTYLPRRTSPLGPQQHLLPGRPVFPPSIHKPDLYRQALKKSTLQAKKRHIRHMERKNLGGRPRRQNTLIWPTSPCRNTGGLTVMDESRMMHRWCVDLLSSHYIHDKVGLMHNPQTSRACDILWHCHRPLAAVDM